MTRKDKLRVFGEWLIAFIKQPFHSYAHFMHYKQRKYETAVQNGHTLKIIARNQTRREAQCNHRKGGDGIKAVIDGRGVSEHFAVIKHTFANFDTWVTCIRCGKKWKPGSEGYAEALAFPTQNTPSSAIRFYGEDFIERHREATKNS